MKKIKPINPLFREDAKYLIGKEVLCAQDEEGLGYYATLVRIENSNKPFICILDTHKELKWETTWKWIVGV